MKTFILSKRDDGRVILDNKKHGEVLKEIKANTWLDAREKVSEINFYHNPGYGWFER